MWCPRPDEYWLNVLENDPGALDRRFREENGYPLPWCEVVAAEELQELSWEISSRVAMGRPTIKIYDTFQFLWDHAPGRLPSDHGTFWGDTEPIDEALRRFDVLLDGLVVVVSDARQSDIGLEARGLRTRAKTVYEGHFWHDGTWIIDEDGGWVLVGMHDYPAYFWHFPKPN